MNFSLVIQEIIIIQYNYYLVSEPKKNLSTVNTI